MDDLKTQLDLATGRIAAVRVVMKTLIETRKKEATMSVLDKLDLVVARRDDFNASLVQRSDELLDRYAKADVKADKAFGKHHAQLDAEEHKLDATEAAIDRMSNMGNSPGSEPSSEQPKPTGA